MWSPVSLFWMPSTEWHIFVVSFFLIRIRIRIRWYVNIVHVCTLWLCASRLCCYRRKHWLKLMFSVSMSLSCSKDTLMPFSWSCGISFHFHRLSLVFFYTCCIFFFVPLWLHSTYTSLSVALYVYECLIVLSSTIRLSSFLASQAILGLRNVARCTESYHVSLHFRYDGTELLRKIITEF